MFELRGVEGSEYLKKHKWVVMNKVKGFVCNVRQEKQCLQKTGPVKSIMKSNA